MPVLSYVLGHDQPPKTNTMDPRAIDCLYLGFVGTVQGGHRLCHINTNEWVSRQCATLVPITDAIGKAVKTQAARDKMPKGVKTFTKWQDAINNSAWLAGVGNDGPPKQQGDDNNNDDDDEDESYDPDTDEDPDDSSDSEEEHTEDQSVGGPSAPEHPIQSDLGTTEGKESSQQQPLQEPADEEQQVPEIRRSSRATAPPTA